MNIITYGETSDELAARLQDVEFLAALRALYERGAAPARGPDSHALNWLARLGFVYLSDGLYSPSDRLLIVGQELFNILVTRAREASAGYAGLLTEEIPSFREQYEQTNAARVQQLHWDEMWCLLVAGLLVDIVAGQRFARLVGGVAAGHLGAPLLWIFGDPPGTSVVNFGVQLHYFPNQRLGLGRVWHGSGRRGDFIAGDGDLEFLARLLGPSPAIVCGERDARSVLKLRYLGVIRGHPPRLTVASPVFSAADVACLFGRADRIARRALSGGVIPYLDELLTSGLSGVRCTGALMQFFYRLVMEHTLPRLFRAGWLSPNGSRPGIDSWIWLGDPLDAYLISGRTGMPCRSKGRS